MFHWFKCLYLSEYRTVSNIVDDDDGDDEDGDDEISVSEGAKDIH